MQESIVTQGQSLFCCLGPERSDGNYTGATVGENGCLAITVSQLRGPMGWFDVAVIEFENQRDMIMPLHMADEVRMIEKEVH